MKNISILLLFTLLAFNLTSKPLLKISFFHVSDTHGFIEPIDKDGFSDIGGATYLVDYMNMYREIEKNKGFKIIGLHSGDIFQKSSYGVFFKGKATISLLNLMPFDYAVPGNHEFDVDFKFLKNLPNIMKATVLCSNIRLNNKFGKRLFLPYKKKIINGTRLFIIGLVTPQSNEMKSPRFKDEVLVTDFKEELSEIFNRELISTNDAVIILDHCELTENEIIANSFGRKIDLIFGGHDHEVFHKKINGVSIVHSGSYFRGFSVFESEFHNGNVFRYKYKYVPVGNRIVAKELTKWKKKLNEMTDKIIAKSKKEYSASSAKSEMNPLCYFIADIIRKYSKSDIGFINSGGVREFIPKGDVKIKDIIKIFPYDNYIAKFNISGKNLKQLVSLSIKNKGKNSFLHFAGIKVDTEAGIKIFFNNQIVTDEDNFSIATSDFLTNGGDGYSMLKNFKLKKYNLIRDCFLEEVQNNFPFPTMPSWLK